jgi:hypothetical protein
MIDEHLGNVTRSIDSVQKQIDGAPLGSYGRNQNERYLKLAKERKANLEQGKFNDEDSAHQMIGRNLEEKDKLKASTKNVTLADIHKNHPDMQAFAKHLQDAHDRGKAAYGSPEHYYIDGQAHHILHGKPKRYDDVTLSPKAQHRRILQSMSHPHNSANDTAMGEHKKALEYEAKQQEFRDKAESEAKAREAAQMEAGNARAAKAQKIEDDFESDLATHKVKGSYGQIKINARSGETYNPESIIYPDNDGKPLFAVHKHIDGGKQNTVTHVPTGLALGHFDKQKDATRVALALHKHHRHEMNTSDTSKFMNDQSRAKIAKTLKLAKRERLSDQELSS